MPFDLAPPAEVSTTKTVDVRVVDGPHRGQTVTQPHEKIVEGGQYLFARSRTDSRMVPDGAPAGFERMDVDRYVYQWATTINGPTLVLTYAGIAKF